MTKLCTLLTLVLLLSMLPSQVTASDSVEKTFCTQAIDYKSLDALKTDLLSNVKRLAVNELFGELITASTAVENFVVTSDQIRTSSIGFVHLEGIIDYQNGENLAEVCVTIRAYTTEQDREKFKPLKLTKRHCIANPDLTTRELTTFGKEEVIVQALLDYDRRLEENDRNDLLHLMQRVYYSESGFIPDTETYCARVEGAIVPIEIITLLETHTSMLNTKSIANGDDLIHQYKFDENSGSIAFDHVKTGAVNGVLSSTVAQVNGLVGRGAIKLMGQTSSVVSFGSGVGQFGTLDFTIAFWLKTSETALPLFDLVGNRTAGSCGNFFQTRMTGTHPTAGNGVISAGIVQDGACTNYIALNSGPGFNDDQRHHVAVTREGVTMTLYVDGVQVASGSAAGAANVANGNLFKIGRSLNDPCCLGNFTPVATFDDLRLYNRSLTADEIEYLANEGR